MVPCSFAKNLTSPVLIRCYSTTRVISQISLDTTPSRWKHQKHSKPFWRTSKILSNHIFGLSGKDMKSRGVCRTCSHAPTHRGKTASGPWTRNDKACMPWPHQTFTEHLSCYWAASVVLSQLTEVNSLAAKNVDQGTTWILEKSLHQTPVLLGTRDLGFKVCLHSSSDEVHKTPNP